VSLKQATRAREPPTKSLEIFLTAENKYASFIKHSRGRSESKIYQAVGLVIRSTHSTGRMRVMEGEITTPSQYARAGHAPCHNDC
jgi:hypothetical protein